VSVIDKFLQIINFLQIMGNMRFGFILARFSEKQGNFQDIEETGGSAVVP
jgi:hypothetical protein